MSEISDGIIIKKEIEPGEQVKFKFNIKLPIVGEPNYNGDKILFKCPKCGIGFHLHPDVFKDWFECVSCKKSFIVKEVS